MMMMLMIIFMIKVGSWLYNYDDRDNPVSDTVDDVYFNFSGDDEDVDDEDDDDDVDAGVLF